MGAHEALRLGRSAFKEQRWSDACRGFAAADAIAALGPADLDDFATATYLVGDEAASADARARAHAGFLDRGDPIRAARSAFWQAFALIDKPDARAQAGGWISRARRLLDECGDDCVEEGFLLCIEGVRKATGGDLAAAVDAFERASVIGARFRNPDLLALARHGSARGMIRQNRPGEGFALLDEVMVGVASGELSPMVTGVVYCSVISACHDAFDLRRAQEWTAALSAWCAAHPDMVPFRAQCLIRRSEVLQLHGEWPQAAAEAERATEWCAKTAAVDSGAACYQQAEIHRVRGDFDAADEWYRRAVQSGKKPYPGVALLRLAQGQLDAAVATVERMLLELRETRARARVLSAAVEVLLAVGRLDAARDAAEELAQIAAALNAPVLRASAAQSIACVLLASDDARGALPILADALALWQDLGAPYETARLRAVLGVAYRRIGDEEGAQLELESALEALDHLGARFEAARVAELARAPSAARSGALTGREVEVLRLVATGRTNRQIAGALSISEKTVARHLNNIFTKLDLPSRAAATAYAYEHKLI